MFPIRLVLNKDASENATDIGDAGKWNKIIKKKLEV